jgi:hypothetical protein
MSLGAFAKMLYVFRHVKEVFTEGEVVLERTLIFWIENRGCNRGKESYICKEK